MDEPQSRDSNILMAKVNPYILLKGEAPRLVDEWQFAPTLWDAVRFMVDQKGDNENSQYACHVFCRGCGDGRSWRCCPRCERAAWAKLTKDIASTATDWVPIGTDDDYPYRGTFDGCGYTISGVSNAGVENAPKYAGIFGCLGELWDDKGTVKNLKLKDIDIHGTTYIGGVAGDNEYGIVEDCLVSGNVSCTNTTGYVGGIVGRNQSYVQRCGVTGCVTYYSSGSSSKRTKAGGVVGGNDGYVYDCYNSGDIRREGSGSDFYVGGVVGDNGGYIWRCYKTGTMSGNNLSGIVSYNSGYIYGCHLLSGVVSGDRLVQNNVAQQDYTTALTAEEFIDENNFTDWDFDKTWVMGEAAPLLRTVAAPTAQEVVVSGSTSDGTGYTVAIPYTWIEEYDLAAQGADAAAHEAAVAPDADSDSDGLPNWAEYMCGTSPTNAAEKLTASIVMEADGPAVTCPEASGIAAGFKAVVKGTDNLADALSKWSVVTDSKTCGFHFFRVEVVPK